MPRSRGGGGRPSAPSRAPTAPSRPNVAPPAPQQARPASTAAAPPMQGRPGQTPAQSQAPAQQGSGGGLFGNMASTAAGVAVGSTLGHGLSSMLGFGGSQAPAETQDQQLQQGYTQAQNSSGYGQQGACEMDAKNFTRCMDEHNGNMTICSWYLEQLKACQRAAGQY